MAMPNPDDSHGALEPHELETAAAEFRERLEAYKDQISLLRVDFPPADLPKSDLPEPAPALIHSNMTLAEHVETLRARKDYAT
jgi:hypothetical protein